MGIDETERLSLILDSRTIRCTDRSDVINNKQWLSKRIRYRKLIDYTRNLAENVDRLLIIDASLRYILFILSSRRDTGYLTSFNGDELPMNRLKDIQRRSNYLRKYGYYTFVNTALSRHKPSLSCVLLRLLIYFQR